MTKGRVESCKKLSVVFYEPYLHSIVTLRQNFVLLFGL